MASILVCASELMPHHDTLKPLEAHLIIILGIYYMILYVASILWLQITETCYKILLRNIVTVAEHLTKHYKNTHSSNNTADKRLRNTNNNG